MTLFEAETPASGRTSAPSPQRTHLALVVAYDGTDFHGFAAQPEQRTVAGVLRDALDAMLRGDVQDFACAGRTDAGVHAWGQVVSLSTATDVAPDRLAHALTKRLGPEVVVRSARVVDDGFDARHSAVARSYRYTVVNRPAPDPFLARYAWWVGEPLDLSLLRLGADPFVGEHDFAAFCRAGPPGSSTVRRVLASRWEGPHDGVLHYEIVATAFCWQMVRSIVGLLVDVGAGRRRPGDVMAVIRSQSRANATRLAPPQGLCLREVGYDEPADSPR